MNKFVFGLIKMSIFVFFLNGCASINKEQCENMNWVNRGYSDGKEGLPANQFAKYQAQCAKHKITIDQEHYRSGHQDGLKIFCTYENGMRQGEEGESNELVCPENLASEFNRGHQAGYKVYELRAEIERQKKAQEEALAKQKSELEDLRKKSDEATLNSMNECTFDSDCAPRMCGSEFITIGSASGFVRKCQ